MCFSTHVTPRSREYTSQVTVFVFTWHLRLIVKLWRQKSSNGSPTLPLAHSLLTSPMQQKSALSHSRLTHPRPLPKRHCAQPTQTHSGSLKSGFGLHTGHNVDARGLPACCIHYVPLSCAQTLSPTSWDFSGCSWLEIPAAQPRVAAFPSDHHLHAIPLPPACHMTLHNISQPILGCQHNSWLKDLVYWVG